MKSKNKILLIITIFMLSVPGCGRNIDFESQLTGTWYLEGNQEAAFVLYDDGTCEITGDYGTGTWSVVKNNQFKLTNSYGGEEIATIVGIENNCLTLKTENNQVQFWNSPQISNDEKIEIESDMNTQNSKQDEPEIVFDNIEKLASTSEIQIVNVVEDGTLWVIEEDESGQEYIVHTNIYGDVLGKVIYKFDGDYEFDGYLERGIDGNLFVIKNSDNVKIYDINSLEEVSSTYIGDFDNIISSIQTEQGIVLVAKKIVESFEEKYACLKISDISGNEIFNISLDRNTLLNEYNIEVSNLATSADMRYAGNNVYYIEYIGPKYERDTLNSLVIDLNRNKIIPVAFPSDNGLYCRSDGNYTIVHSTLNETIIVNHETGIVEEFPNKNYFPEGILSEGIFYAKGNNGGMAFLDIQGNVLIDLNQYSQSVQVAKPFKNNIALIGFANDYITYIDINGKFLFEPIKGHIKSYDENKSIALVESEEGKYIAVDKNGNITNMDLLPYSRDCVFVEYEGKQYWVAGGKLGLYSQEYEPVN